MLALGVVQAKLRQSRPISRREQKYLPDSTCVIQIALIAFGECGPERRQPPSKGANWGMEKKLAPLAPMAPLPGKLHDGRGS